MDPVSSPQTPTFVERATGILLGWATLIFVWGIKATLDIYGPRLNVARVDKDVVRTESHVKVVQNDMKAVATKEDVADMIRRQAIPGRSAEYGDGAARSAKLFRSENEQHVGR